MGLWSPSLTSKYRKQGEGASEPPLSLNHQYEHFIVDGLQLRFHSRRNNSLEVLNMEVQESSKEDEQKQLSMRHISLDFWGTMFKPNPLYKPLRNQLVRSLLFDNKLSEEEVAGLVKSTKDNMERAMICTGTQPNWYYMMAYLATSRPDINVQNIGERIKALRQENSNLVYKCSPIIMQDVRGTLKQLVESGITLNILSNTTFIPGDDLDRVLRKEGLLNMFEFRVYSDQLLVCKPSTAAFSKIISTPEYSVGDVMHVGDDPRTDGASEKLGIFPLIIREGEFSNILKYI